MNKQTITIEDLEIIKSHKKKFLKPITTIFKLIESGMSDDRILQANEFKKVALELQEIDKQGLKKQFLIFYEMLML